MYKKDSEGGVGKRRSEGNVSNLRIEGKVGVGQRPTRVIRN
jgi:hypothetical protein